MSVLIEYYISIYKRTLVFFLFELIISNFQLNKVLKYSNSSLVFFQKRKINFKRKYKKSLSIIVLKNSHHYFGWWYLNKKIILTCCIVLFLNSKTPIDCLNTINNESVIQNQSPAMKSFMMPILTQNASLCYSVKLKIRTTRIFLSEIR